jgi:hypothetical protein
MTLFHENAQFSLDPWDCAVGAAREMRDLTIRPTLHLYVAHDGNCAEDGSGETCVDVHTPR